MGLVEEPAPREESPATSQDEQEALDILASGSQTKYKRRWIEFDCQNGVHHGKWSTYKDGKRIREKGGHIGRFDKVASLGEYATRRVEEFVTRNHACHYPDRCVKDLEECGITGIKVEGWPSGRSLSGLSGGGRADTHEAV